MSQRVRKIVSILRKQNEPQFRLKQVLDGVYGDRPVAQWYDIESIPRSLQFALTEELGRDVSNLRPIQQIEDKEATKQLFAIAEDGGGGESSSSSRTSSSAGSSSGSSCGKKGTPARDSDSSSSSTKGVFGSTSSLSSSSSLTIPDSPSPSSNPNQKQEGKSTDLPKIEAVSLRFQTHRSLCISSQVGCAFKCAFCATGAIGFKRQLSADEIVDQILFFQRYHQRESEKEREELWLKQQQQQQQTSTISLATEGAPVRSSVGSGVMRLSEMEQSGYQGEQPESLFSDDPDIAEYESKAVQALKLDKDARTKLYREQDAKRRIDSVSIMGMGEALGNPKIFDALEIMTDPNLLNYSQRRINVSTVGVIPGMVKLLERFPQCNLAFSLHSPFGEERDRLVPLNRMYPFEEVFKYLDERIEKTGRRIWIAYLLLPGTNDSIDHAKALVDIIKNRPIASKHLYHVNLLPYNDTSVGETQGWRGRSPAVEAFHKELKEARISCSYRNSFGTEIDAACGQLFASYERNKVISVTKGNKVKRNYTM